MTNIRSKFSALKAAILAAASLSALPAFAAGAAATPAANNPELLKSYVLQSFDDKGAPNSVAITDTLHNQYFFSNCAQATDCFASVPQGATIFKVPSGFPSTPNSHFPRTELRGTTNFQAGQTFHLTQTGTAYIIQNPSTKSLIFAQIHGDKAGGSELFKLRWIDGKIIAGVKPNYGDKEQKTTLLSGIGLNQPVQYILQADSTGDAITVTLDVSAQGKSAQKTFSFPASGWQGINLYFKAGNYSQDAEKTGPDAIIAYSALKFTGR